jgi:hypothetical protein
MTEFYVYQYVDKEGNPYYIGKGKGNRINVKHKFTEVPDIEQRQILKNNLTEIEALILENTLVRMYGRKLDGGILDNIKLNQWACLSGWTHSEETKRKISEKHKGLVKSEETKQKMRKPKSKEHAEKIRLANLGRVDSKERCEKNKKAQMNLEVRAIKSQKMKELIAQRKALGLKWGRGS